MNIFALVILFAVLVFLVVQVKALIVTFKQRKKDKKQVNNKSEIKGDKVVNDRD